MYKTVLSYCLKCKQNTQSINPVNAKTSNTARIILSKCAVCTIKKSRFVKKQEASGILSNSGLKIPVLRDLLF